jgi:ABC-2 type transport system permease protein
MTADARELPTRLSIPLRRRLFGLGSIFGKTLRDSRRAILIVGGFISLLILISGAFVSSTWGTPETRAEGVALTTVLPPIFTGLYGGSAIAADTLGGFTNWRYGLLFFVLPGIWSILALSGTLVSEMRRGSMEFVAGSPINRRRIALEKLGGHVAAMTIAMLIAAFFLWLIGTVFVTLPGDEISAGAALGYALAMGLSGLVAGTIAFALAPFIGRGAGAGIAALILVGSWIVFGYRESVELFEAILPISWFSWFADHRPIAGLYDWGSLLPLAGIVLVAGAVGVVVFERRDLGDVGALRLPSRPPWLLGLSGPLTRSFGERLNAAVAWGLGIGLYAIIIAVSAGDLQRIIAETPTLEEVMRLAFPNADLDQPGFALQVLFVQLGTLLGGAAAASLVGGWASDESEGRLEMLLTPPIARFRWMIETGIATYAAVVVTALVVGVATALAIATSGGDVLTPFSGVFVIALYGGAVAGIGLAVGGLVRPSLAAPTVVVVIVGMLLIDILGPVLQLPEWVSNLSLARHYGEPMIGTWNPVGVIASLALAIGGLLIGAWGFSRRDLRG